MVPLLYCCQVDLFLPTSLCKYNQFIDHFLAVAWVVEMLSWSLIIVAHKLVQVQSVYRSLPGSVAWVVEMLSWSLIIVAHKLVQVQIFRSLPGLG